MQTLAYWLMVPFMVLALILEALSDKVMEGVEWFMLLFEKKKLTA
jgi:hypothetical protein